MPHGDVPYPRIDLDRLANPMPAILASAEFADACASFAAAAAAGRSLIPPEGHAVIHALIRNQRPAHAVEIGCYQGGTTEIMARAVLENGAGTVHTIGPFDAERFLPVYERWPRELQQAVRFYPIDSMAFYMEIERQGIRPGLVLVDGCHDHEFALFDIACAARRLMPGGFILIDDSSHPGPYFAAQDFIAAHPDWIDCAASQPGPWDPTIAFDTTRTHVPGTRFIVLRAPPHYRLADQRPLTFGEVAWERPRARGLALSLDGAQADGVLHVQCIMRGFGGDQPPAREIKAASQAIAAGVRDIEIMLPEPLMIAPPRDRHTLEPWLIWIGQGPLRLTRIPVPF